MNQKRIAALAFVASLAATTIPSFAATTGTVTVKWNTQALASIIVNSQASTGGPTITQATQNIYWNGNTSVTSGCAGSINTATAGTDPASGASPIVNFGNVTPDSAQYTDCMETNAVEAYVVTNDTNGWKVQAGISAAAPANYGVAGGTNLCLLPNGTWANNLAYTASGRSAAPSIVSATACPAGDFQIGATAPGTTLLSTTASTAGTNLNADLELVLGPNAPSGAQAPVVTYTLVAL